MKILVVIESYGTGNDVYMRRLVEEYLSMPFDTQILVISNFQKPVPTRVEVRVVPKRKTPWHNLDAFKSGSLRAILQEYRDWKRQLDLALAHKQIFADCLNEYDLFIYSEDDTLVTERNVRAFLRASAVLPENEIAGFLRYEEAPGGGRNYPEVHGHYHWDTRSVRRRREETFAFFTNEHAAVYLATREQLRRAIASGEFLKDPKDSRYDLLCTAATDIYTRCGLRKMIGISRLDDFLIHHLPNKYVGSKFGIGDPEMRRQISELLRIGERSWKGPLFHTETRLKDAAFSKGYYEPIWEDSLAELPDGLRSVLSIGTSSGATEAALQKKGLAVTAVPLDPVIAGHAAMQGVELVSGDFEEVRSKLKERRFDCILISNVLHLVPKPVDLLVMLGGLLAWPGVVVAAVANTSRLEADWQALRGKEVYSGDMFRKTGAQRTSEGTIRSWFADAGFRVMTVLPVLGERAEKVDQATRGVVKSWLAAEFIVTAEWSAEPRRSECARSPRRRP